LLWATEALLAGTDGDLLLFIDQFEEIFTLSEDNDEREHVLNLLYHAVVDPASRLRVIVTLRADFMDRPLQYVPFGELMRERTEFVLPLTPDEIERAISSPAERVGLHVDSELLAAVVVDVRDEPGALPLLQYAMTELFERRDRDRLSLTAYRESGGVLGALARRAQDVYGGLPPDCANIARQVFLRLITLGEGTDDTRRRVKRSELLSMVNSPDALKAVLDSFGVYRLLTFDRDPETREPTVEIAHEALIREWGQLRQWLETSRADVRLQRQLATAINEWNHATRRKDFLLTGGRLAQFEDWAAQTDLALTTGEREFLDASIADRQRLEAEETARLEREAKLERRSRTVLRILALGSALAAVLAIGLSAFAFYASRTAQSERQIAQNERAIAQTRAEELERLAAQLRLIALRGGVEAALDADDNDLARALAIEANDPDQPSREAQALLAEAVYTPGTMRMMEGHSAPVLDIAFTPDGRTAVSASFDGSAIIWDVATGAILHRLEGHTAWVSALAVSPDGLTVLTASTDHTLILWDIETGDLIRRYEGHSDWVTNVVFSPDGRHALSSAGNLLGMLNPLQWSRDNSLIWWDIETGEVVRRIEGLSQPTRGLAISPDGQTALTADLAGVVTAWDIETGEIRARYEGHENLLMTVAFTPDGRYAYSAGADTNVIEWNLETGERARTLVGHTSAITDIAISPDGRFALTGATDNVIFLWSLETGTIIRRLYGHPDQVAAVAFSPDGRYALSGGGKLFEAAAGVLFASSIRLWDLENGAVVQRYEAEGMGIAQVAFSQNGQDILTAAPDALIRWNRETGDEMTRTAITLESTGQGIVNNMTFSPNERYALAADGAGDMTLWDMTTGELARRFSGHTLGVGDIDFSPDGRTVLSASSDSSIVLWDVESGAEINRYRMSEESLIQVWSVAFSPDGRTFVSGGHEGSIMLWNVETGGLVSTFPVEHAAGIVRFAWSADASRLVSASGDGTLILWDVATGTVLQHFVGHKATVMSAAFSPDERYLLSGSGDSTMILWDVTDGQPIYIYAEHDAAVTTVAFSADGQYALSGSADGTAILWRIDPTLDSLTAWTTANRTIPPLACDERRRFGLDESICESETA